MSSFLQDLKGSFGILANPDVISYLMRGLMFTLAISIIAIAVSLVLGVILALTRNYCTLCFVPHRRSARSLHSCWA